MNDSFSSPAIRTSRIANVDARREFLSRTYMHLFGAILAFTAIEYAIFQTGAAETVSRAIFGAGRFGWLAVLGGFMVVGWLATHVTHAVESKPAQYLALAGFVAAEAIIFVPLLWIANRIGGGEVIHSAAYATLAGFTGLTAIVVFSKRDFSFLGAFLKWAGVCAVLLIVLGLTFNFSLGVFFAIAMVVVAGASILYDTSRVFNDYPEDRYVGAALELFSSVALLFWYVLRIFMSRR
jgi:uncharacterized protein